MCSFSVCPRVSVYVHVCPRVSVYGPESRGAEATISMLAEMGANASAATRNGVGGAAMAAASGVPGALKAALAAGAPTSLRPPGWVSTYPTTPRRVFETMKHDAWSGLGSSTLTSR